MTPLRHTTPVTARFWDHINGSHVRLALRDGQTFTHAIYASTDEGYSYEATTWSFEDGDIICHRYTRGRDCDGLHEHEWSGACAFASRYGYIDNDVTPAINMPLWRIVDTSQRDHTAEAAGY